MPGDLNINSLYVFDRGDMGKTLNNLHRLLNKDEPRGHDGIAVGKSNDEPQTQDNAADTTDKSGDLDLKDIPSSKRVQSHKKKWIIIGGVLVGVAVVAVGAYGICGWVPVSGTRVLGFINECTKRITDIVCVTKEWCTKALGKAINDKKYYEQIGLKCIGGIPGAEALLNCIDSKKESKADSSTTNNTITNTISNSTNSNTDSSALPTKLRVTNGVFGVANVIIGVATCDPFQVCLGAAGIFVAAKG